MPAASRLMAAIRRAADWLLVLALLGLGEGEVWLGWDVNQVPSLRPADGALVLVAALPLLMRRIAPVAVLLVTMAIAGVWIPIVHPSSQPPLTALLIVLVAVYSAAAYTSGRRTWLVAGLLLIPGVARIPALISGRLTPGEVFWVYIFVGVAWGLGRLIGRQRMMAASLREYALQLEREREERARLAVTEERTRIARELHDIVAHSVSLMVLQAGAARQSLDWDPGRAREPLVAIERSGRAALAELRRMLGILRATDQVEELSPQPSLSHLQGLIDQVEKAGVQVRLRIEGEPYDVARGLDLSLYRILQEALTNSVKHAGPCEAEVAIRYLSNWIEIAVTDDGNRALTAPRGADGTGHGLLGMRERAALYGGRLEAGPCKDGGYAVVARIPVEASEK